MFSWIGCGKLLMFMVPYIWFGLFFGFIVRIPFLSVWVMGFSSLYMSRRMLFRAGLLRLLGVLGVVFVLVGFVVRFLVGLGVFVLALWVLRFVGVVVGFCWCVVGFCEC